MHRPYATGTRPADPQQVAIGPTVVYGAGGAGPGADVGVRKRVRSTLVLAAALTLAAACGGGGGGDPDPNGGARVPDLIGMTGADAQAAVAAAGLSVGSVAEEHSILLPTGLVVDQTPASGADVASNTSVDLVLVQTPPVGAGESIHESWVGEWQFTVTFIDPSDNSIVGADETSVSMCAGDPVGSMLLEQVASDSPDLGVASCTGSASEDRIATSCSTQVDNPLCAADVSFEIELDLHGDAAVGAGAWTPTLSCVLPVAVDGESFTIAAERTEPSLPTPCSSPTSSLVQKLMPLIVGHFQDRLP